MYVYCLHRQFCCCLFLASLLWVEMRDEECRVYTHEPCPALSCPSVPFRALPCPATPLPIPAACGPPGFHISFASRQQGQGRREEVTVVSIGGVAGGGAQGLTPRIACRPQLAPCAALRRATPRLTSATALICCRAELGARREPNPAPARKNSRGKKWPGLKN